MVLVHVLPDVVHLALHPEVVILDDVSGDFVFFQVYHQVDHLRDLQVQRVLLGVVVEFDTELAQQEYSPL